MEKKTKQNERKKAFENCLLLEDDILNKHVKELLFENRLKMILNANLHVK